MLANTIDNKGTITLAGGNIQISRSATLTGGGTVNIGGYSISSGTLTNVDNRIQGAGGFRNIAVNSQSAGVINANTSGQTLSFTAGAPSTIPAFWRPATVGRCNSAGATGAAARPM